MTLEKIETHVVEEARAKAGEIADATRAECEKIAADAREEADAAFAAAVERLKADLANAFGHAVGKLHADHRLESLRIRTAILDDVFAKARDKLLHDEDYWQLTRAQLRTVAGKTGAVRCRAAHREALARMIDELNAELKEKVPPLADDPVDILGGFVLEGRKFDLDFSLDAQLDAFREKVLSELLVEAFQT